MQLLLSFVIIASLSCFFFSVLFYGVSTDFMKVSDEAVQRAERRKARV